ncbi:hypothetical protein LTR36_001172 [Oleoguttula mirabilis]|uniref:Uncharacterized protein n=1 Tax=Oleoguttula mirabilis TaxID=1507867 RepID=A0AAV9J2W5_9PEZI|nr:hypothetical protein LTR36_001172 [Oleoguttula mirabilis]
MDSASYAPLTPEATHQSAAPSANGTPLSFSGSSTPIPHTRSSTPTTPRRTSYGPSKSVLLHYGDNSLSGQLYLIRTGDYLNGLFPRFFDIPPSAETSVNGVKEPFVLVHAVQGLSWVDARELPALQNAFGQDGQRVGDHFIAVTDDAWLWNSVRLLGKCELDGTFDPFSADHTDIILALPCLKALPNPPNARLSAKKPAKVYPPVPIAPALYATITKIRTVLTANSSNTTHSSGISRRYINTDLAELLDPDTQVLSQQHPLWRLRGNVALWKVAVWNMLCYKSNVKKAEKEAQPLPEAYFEEVFEDRREMERETFLMPSVVEEVKGLEGKAQGDK